VSADLAAERRRANRRLVASGRGGEMPPPGLTGPEVLALAKLTGTVGKVPERTSGGPMNGFRDNPLVFSRKHKASPGASNG
jgi:hypothetical protein